MNTQNNNNSTTRPTAIGGGNSNPSSGLGTATNDKINNGGPNNDPSFPIGSSNTGTRLYSKELRCMMYGFGDDRNPYTESVDLLEDLVIKYITDMTNKAMEVGKSNKITVDNIMYLVRRDPRKHARVKDLLIMNEELKKSRKAFDLEMLATQPNNTSNTYPKD